MKIMVNGHPEIIVKSTIAAYVQSKKLQTDGLVVEYNQRIIAQAQWKQIELVDNDSLELLGFVGGG